MVSLQAVCAVMLRTNRYSSDLPVLETILAHLERGCRGRECESQNGSERRCGEMHFGVGWKRLSCNDCPSVGWFVEGAVVVMKQIYVLWTLLYTFLTRIRGPVSYFQFISASLRSIDSHEPWPAFGPDSFPSTPHLETPALNIERSATASNVHHDTAYSKFLETFSLHVDSWAAPTSGTHLNLHLRIGVRKLFQEVCVFLNVMIRK